jgi:site-specific recombinase XerD
MVLDQQTKEKAQSRTVSLLDQQTNNYSGAKTLSGLRQKLNQITQSRTLLDLEELLGKGGLSGILDNWMFECHQADCPWGTLKFYYSDVSEFLEFLGPTIADPKQITKKHVVMFLQLRKQFNRRYPGQPIKPSYLHGFFRALKRYFNYMVENDILEVSPMDHMKAPKVPDLVIQPYSKEQIQVLLSACDSNTFLGARNKALILLFITSGLRKFEMAKIKLADVNITDKMIKVMGKGSKERVVGFGVQTSKALMIYFIQRKARVKDGHEEWLWLSEEGTRLGYWGVGQAITELEKLVGINDIHSRIHALRHTFATEALRNGAKMHEVQELLGHVTPVMTKRYAKTVDSYDAVKQHSKFDPIDHWF